MNGNDEQQEVWYFGPEEDEVEIPWWAIPLMLLITIVTICLAVFGVRR